MKILRDILWYLIACFSLAPINAHACVDPIVPSFRETLPKATSVVIVRVESISLLPQRQKEIVIVPDMVARIRVSEVIKGRKPKAELIRFTGTWCGGHNLKVGEYYVLLVDRDSKVLDLERGSQSIVYLFGEYNERDGGRKSDSVLLMHLRNFVRLGTFPDSFPVEKLLEHNYVQRNVSPQL
jgi:hypothetical protein